MNTEEIGTMTGPEKPALRRHKPRWGVLVLVLVGHVLVGIALVRAFAPDLPGMIVEKAASLVTVTVTTPDPEPVETPKADEGAAAEAGHKATPKEAAAPEPRITNSPTPVPRASSTGTEVDSGATDAGEGSGSEGSGIGTGSGTGGSGPGGCPISSRPSKVEGNINSASDYGVPPGGRQARFGTSVTIALTVGLDGVPTACRIHTPGPFPETNARTCELAMARFRFCPAIDRNGNPIVSTYGWRQEFRRAE
jgi:protein TonB